MKKVYVASRVENWKLAKKLAMSLENIGYEITYKWFDVHLELHNEPIAYQSKIAQAEIDAVLAADGVIVVAPGARGSHTEFGAALGQGKPVFLWARTEEDLLNEEKTTCSFYYHPCVTISTCLWEDLPTEIKIWSQNVK